MDKAKKTLIRVMALGTFVVVLDNTIMNVSISALVADLNTTVSGVQAAIALNALMMAAFVLMGGKLADILGMKRTFLAGAVIYVIGSLLASFSNNLAVFVLGWCAIQGFGAALMLPNVTTIIRANVPAGAARAAAYGTMAGINALGLAIGPLIGGFLTTYFSWRWAFRLEVFFLVIVLLYRNVIPADTLGKVRSKLDKIGVVWQAAAMILIVLGVLLISDYGLLLAKQPLVLFGTEFSLLGLSIVPFLVFLGLVCLYMFVRNERTVEAKRGDVLVDLKLFTIRAFTKGLNIRFLQVALVAGTTFAVPLYLQVTYGLSAFETGLILLGFTAGLLLTSIGASKYGLQYAAKQKIELGFLVSILGLLGMTLYVSFGHSAAGMIPGIFIYGLGLGLVTSQIVNSIMATVSANQTAEAAGITSTLETLGSSVGTAVVGTILVVSLTAFAGNFVQQSTVFSPEAKTQISSQMSKSIDVVSTSVISDTIKENGKYEKEAVRIYDEARQKAFMLTLLFMACTALLSYGLATRLSSSPATVKT
jgi:MFS family permease